MERTLLAMTITRRKCLSKLIYIRLRTVIIVIVDLNRHKRTRDHPKTPPKHLKYSRRAWEGLIKSWRKKLHTFDPSNEDNDVQD
jgi:hypothetical protein